MKMCKDCFFYEKQCKKYIEPTECFPEVGGCGAFKSKKKQKNKFKEREKVKLADINEIKAAIQNLPEQQELKYLGVYDIINSVPTIDTNKISNKPITDDVAQAVSDVGKSVENLLSAYLKLYEGKQNE